MITYIKNQQGEVEKVLTSQLQYLGKSVEILAASDKLVVKLLALESAALAKFAAKKSGLEKLAKVASLTTAELEAIS